MNRLRFLCALVDQNSDGLDQISRHRQAELRGLLNSEFRRTLLDKGAELITYRALIARKGPGGR